MNPFTLKLISELDSLLLRYFDVTVHDLLRGLDLSFEDLYIMVEDKLKEAGAKEARQTLLLWVNLTSVMFQEQSLGREMTEEEVLANAKDLGLLLE